MKSLPLAEPFFLAGRTSILQRAVIMSVVLGRLALLAAWIVVVAYFAARRGNCRHHLDSRNTGPLRSVLSRSSTARERTAQLLESTLGLVDHRRDANELWGDVGLLLQFAVHHPTVDYPWGTHSQHSHSTGDLRNYYKSAIREDINMPG